MTAEWLLHRDHDCAARGHAVTPDPLDLDALEACAARGMAAFPGRMVSDYKLVYMDPDEEDS